MNKLLLIIDVQNDFMDGGKLAVKGSTEKINKCVEYIAKHGKDYTMTAATVDWHPITHCSFNINGGQWPPHCLQHSVGAAIYEPLLMTLNENTNYFEIFTKGCNEDHEEYSVFKNAESCEKLLNLVNKLDIKEIDVFGIALDYCVRDSLLDGKRYIPNVKFRLFKDFSPSIGDSQKVLDELENKNFEIV